MVKYNSILKQVSHGKIPWCLEQANLAYQGISWNILIRVGADADSYVTVLLCKIL